MPNTSTRSDRLSVTMVRDQPPRGKRRWLALLAAFGLTFGAAAIGSMFTSASVDTWYLTLNRPPLAPPSWVFGPVWTTLYALMAISAWRVWERRDRPGARRTLSLFGIQLALNVAWSGLFFGLRSPGVALIEIVAMGVAIGAYIVSARRVDATAAWLFVPYFAWVSFATYLNAGYWWLNR